MTGINTGKVLVGGLVAGIVANIIDAASNFLILANDMKAMMARLNLDPAVMESTAGIAAWVLVDLLFGILVVFTYAAMRPRFGPGPKTAIVAGFTLFCAVTFVMYGLSSMGLMTSDLFLKSSACSLVSVLVSSVAGAAVYKEASADQAASTRGRSEMASRA